jgi:hypothetical protein
MKYSFFILALLALVLGGAGPVMAGPITLFNTGVNALGTPLPDGTIGDPHFTMTPPGGSTSTILVRTSAGGFPIPPYIGDDSLSAWIGPNNDTFVDGPAGTYTYHTTFSLAGLNPATASISGLWAVDNEGVSILLNGVSTGNSISTPGAEDPASFEIFHPFSITTGFVTGVNTLDFVVFNDGGPTALRVEMSGTAQSVPEPTSLTLLGIGIAGIAGYGWRRRKAATACDA